MAIFIFRLPNFPGVKNTLGLVASSLVLAVGTPALGAGYVISAQDRVQAAALSQQAYTTFQAGDYPQALDLLVRADQLKPDQPDSWNLRGVILLKEKAYDKAQAAFARAVELDPGLWAAQFNLAEVSFQRKDYARARSVFERLLAQTDRFKAASKWELVQYKVYLSCLLMGDEPAAAKKLAKLPPQGGATPAFLYAEAALSFRHKSLSQAQKSLAAAQAAFPVAINDLFSDSLVQAGWQSPPPPAALAANVPAYPPGTPLAGNPPSPGSNGRPGVVVNPELQAESAGPLPVADAPMRPVVMPVASALRTASTATDLKPKSRPAPTVAAAPPSNLKPGTEPDLLEHGGLLLDE